LQLRKLIEIIATEHKLSNIQLFWSVISFSWSFPSTISVVKICTGLDWAVLGPGQHSIVYMGDRDGTYALTIPLKSPLQNRTKWQDYWVEIKWADSENVFGGWQLANWWFKE